MVCLQLASSYYFQSTKRLNSLSTATSGVGAGRKVLFGAGVVCFNFVACLVLHFALWHLVSNKHLKRAYCQLHKTLEIIQLGEHYK